MSKQTNLTSGPILKSIISFAVPLILTGILQRFYHSVNSMIIGKFSSSLALAGIGCSGSFINLFTNFCIGFSTGANIIIAQRYGRKDSDAVKSAVHTSFGLALILGIILTVTGLILSKPVLIAMDTPKEVFPYAIRYTTIYFCGMLPTLTYNFLASILRAVGDSKSPLYFLIISSILNILLNLVFVVILKIDVAGAALATIISQFVCCILSIIRLSRSHECYQLKLNKIHIKLYDFKKLFTIGFPISIGSCITTFSNMLLQSSVNSFGAVAAAGATAGANIENFIYAFMDSIQRANTTYVAQNYGVRNTKRIKRGIIYSLLLSSTVAMFLGAASFIFKEKLLHLFTNDADAVAYGIMRMSIVSTTYFLCGIMLVLNSSIRSLGDTISPMLVSTLGLLALRVLWIYKILPLHRTFKFLYLSFPVTWIIVIPILGIILIRKLRKIS